MTRPVTLFTGQWGDLPLAELAPLAKSMGYDGLELACWGDHFDVQAALKSDDYVSDKRALLEKHGLQCFALGAHLVGQAVCDRIDERHQGILPPTRASCRRTYGATVTRKACVSALPPK